MRWRSPNSNRNTKADAIYKRTSWVLEETKFSVDTEIYIKEKTQVCDYLEWPLNLSQMSLIVIIPKILQMASSYILI